MDPSTKRILVVDDEEDIRAMLRRAVERQLKIPVDTAASGLEALERIHARHYDLMVTDLAMPEMDGMQLFQAVKKRFPKMQVIVLTATSSLEATMAAVKSHVYSYIQKPITMDRFVKEVESALKEQDAHLSAPEAEPDRDALSILKSVEEIAEEITRRTEGLAGQAPLAAVQELKGETLRLREQLGYLRLFLQKQ